jgi:hypothetical protein
MESYLRDNVHTIEDHYIGPLCNKPIDEFSPREDVVEGKFS